MNYGEDLIALIDQRIRAAATQPRAVGTCVSRATTGPGADVIMDGSTIAVPVKVLGHVFCRPEDRVVLDRYGSDWVVSGSYSGAGLGEASQTLFGPAAGTAQLSSATFVDISEIPAITIDKQYDNTYLRMGLAVGCYLETTANASVQFGYRLTPTDPLSVYVPIDHNLNFVRIGAVSVHQQSYFTARVIDIPAGRYSVQLRWRRVSGTGTFRIDALDKIAMELDENVRTVAPIL